MARLIWEDGTVVDNDSKGGYGLAIEKLAALLGCKGDLRQQACDGPVCSLTATEQPNWDGWVQPLYDGWVNVTDCEGCDAIYFDKQLLATISMGSRAFWKATATTVDGKTLNCEGANIEMECEDWI